MLRPWQTWVIFGIALAVAVAAMGWVSGTVLRLERAEIRASEEAAFESNVRLALWRMDSALAPLIAQESARPWYVYTAFHPAAAAYTRMFAEIARGEVLIPSPLIDQASPHIRLHFQVTDDGTFTSPQVPTSNMRDLAEAAYTTHEKIDAAARRLDALSKLVDGERLTAALGPPDTAPIFAESRPGPNAGQPADHLAKRPGGFEFQRRMQRQLGQLSIEAAGNNPLPGNEQQTFLNDNEWQARGANNVTNYGVFNNDGSNILFEINGVQEGLARPLWIDDELLLARWTMAQGQRYIQGCWFDWSGLREWLLDQVRDLLPNASLQPITDETDSDVDPGRRLAGFPVMLVPGEAPLVTASTSSPIHTSLAIAWVCVVLAALAVAVLLIGTVALSERRAAFVSAVTHEMRTPLTTFRIYTEMLTRGMVGDETKRNRYLATLRAEADRLSHLVGNVLAYARLERRPARDSAGKLDLAEFLERTRERFQDRVERAEMELVLDTDGVGDAADVRADPSAVEQILLNLIDNACKYAADSPDRRVHLEASRRNGFMTLRVRDHGPGISEKDARRLFRPFAKSAGAAADSAPGVGLGLALSRRLARQMDGDLILCRDGESGACFRLDLPTS